MHPSPPERPHHAVSWLQLRPWQRHSLVLAFAGLVYISYGLILLLAHHDGGRPLLLNRPAWATIWMAVGGLALASTRWPPQSKTWGYAALSGLAAAWASIYALGVLLLHQPPAALNGCLVWALVAFLWWAISGLTNPDDHHCRE